MKQLSKSKIQKINQELSRLYELHDFFEKKDDLSLEKIDEKEVLVKDKETLFFYEDNMLIPTLKLVLKENFLPRITVDMGAVKFVTSGADIMRPGIVNIPEGLLNGDIVAVDDETHHKPLAIAKAMFNSEEMKKLEKGKVLKNLHYVGDKIWNH